MKDFVLNNYNDVESVLYCMDFLVRMTIFSSNPKFYVEYEESVALFFSQGFFIWKTDIRVQPNEKFDFWRVPESMKIMKIVFWPVRTQLSES